MIVPAQVMREDQVQSVMENILIVIVRKVMAGKMELVSKKYVLNGPIILKAVLKEVFAH